MSERRLQFAVGSFVLVAGAIGVTLALLFAELPSYFRETYLLAVHFERAAGLAPHVPVRQNGLKIGVVKEVVLDDQQGGVLAVLQIDAGRRLRRDAEATLVQSLLGDASIEFSAGTADELLPPNTRINGRAPTNPMEIVHRMEATVTDTLSTFEATSREWQLVAENMNNLMETRQGDLDLLIENAATSLAEFTEAMQQANVTLTAANRLLADPQVQADLKATVAGLPIMIEDTQQTIAAARTAMDGISSNLQNLDRATKPLADNSHLIVSRLAGSLENLETVLGDLSEYSALLADKDGTLQRFASDPSLYENLDETSESLAVLLRHLQPIISDMRVFSDKVARHPEILGVRGALQGSSGLKGPPVINAGGRQPERQ